MINISSKCLQALKNNAVQRVIIEVEPLRGMPFDLTEKDLMANGFVWENHSVCGEQLEIGTMTVALLELTIDNEDGRFDNIFFAGATLTVKLLIPLGDGTAEPIPFGVYTVDEQPRAWSTISLNAFDNMVKLDIPFDASKLPSGGMTLRNLVREGIETAGLQCDNYDIFNYHPITGKIDVTKIKSESPITWRQVLMWCCECAGACGFADENGHIKFGFYKKYTPEILQTENAEDLETEDNQILLVDGVAEGDFELPPSARFINNNQLEESDIIVTGFQFKDGDKLYPENAVMDYGLRSEGNLVFSACSNKGKSIYSQRVNAAIAGFTYRPYSCDILAFPHLQLLDGVDYIKDGVHCHSIITNLNFKLNGNMSIAAKAKSVTQKGWASLGALTEGQRVIIDSVSQRVDETQADLTAREQFLISFNEAITGSMGFYSTVKEQDDGSRISYMHDKPILEESQTIYTFGVNGFAWTNGGWNDGNPVWQSGFDKNGNAILNAIYAYKLTADVIVSGLLQSQNGASWINMDDGTFCFGSDAGTALALDENKQLNVYGTLKSIKYPNYSVSIGKSQNEGFGSWVVSEDGVGDLMAVRSTINQSGNGALWSVPMLADQFGANIHGIWFYPDQTYMLHAGGGRVVCNQDEAFVANGFVSGAFIGVDKDNISLGSWATHQHCWFNFYEPKNAISPIAYDFGNGTRGGHAELYAAKYNIVSEPSAKENIDEVTDLNALDKINSLKFYRYDYKNEQKVKKTESLVQGKFVQSEEKKQIAQKKAELPVIKIHEKLGIMANEAPTEIVTEDGKAIDLYAYIGLTAKAVQELSAKVEVLEQKISALEAENQALKQ